MWAEGFVWFVAKAKSAEWQIVHKMDGAKKDAEKGTGGGRKG